MRKAARTSTKTARNKPLRSGWQPLSPGARVDIIAPGFKTTKQDLLRGTSVLREWGLKPHFDAKIFGKDLICANSAEQRFRQLKTSLSDPDCQGIWFLRGGYGSIQLLPFLKKMKKPKAAKMMIGLSDITSLHIFFQSHWGWSTLHGPLLSYLADERSPRKAVKEVQSIVFGRQSEVEFSRLKPLNEAARKQKVVRAPLVGGNLAVAASHIGTPFQLDPRGHILFFEDIGERAYRIDRVFQQWQMSGLFAGVKAIVFGQFLGGLDLDGKSRILGVQKEWAEKLNVPVLRGIESGHGRTQRVVPFGVPSVLSTGSQARLVCPTGTL